MEKERDRVRESIMASVVLGPAGRSTATEGTKAHRHEEPQTCFFKSVTLSQQDPNLHPHSILGHSHQPADLLAGNEPSLMFLEYAHEQIPHASPIKKS